MAKTVWPCESRTRRICRISPVFLFSNCKKLSTDHPNSRFFSVQALMIAAISAWRLPILTFECAIEGSFRFVSNIGSDVCDAARCPFEPLGGQLEPPSRQICHRWLREIFGKAFHESGPGNAYLIRKSRNRPRMGNAAM